MEKAAKFGKIGVLMGGPSSEREISFKSGKAVYEALKPFFPDTVAIDIKTAGVKDNLRLLRSHDLDCAFIALHGRFGEDGQIQSILEKLRIAYTGSGVSASKRCMDKSVARRVFARHGVRIPRGTVVYRKSYRSLSGIPKGFAAPVVVKPATHGSSIGLSIVDRAQDFSRALSRAFSFDDHVVIEEYIAGRELTVGILRDKPLPVIEILPKNRFFDYQAKYQSGMTEYRVPAALDEKVARKVKKLAQQAHLALGCNGYSRVDIMLTPGGVPYVLEVNTIPGMTATSLLPKAARVAGIEFPDLCISLLELAYEKK